MTDVYVVRNQLGHYWGKGKLWVDGREARPVMRLKHEDEAINVLFELSSADFELRGEVIEVELSERGDPVIEPSEFLIEIEVEAEKNDSVADEEASANGEPAEETAKEELLEEAAEEPTEEEREDSTPEISAGS